ncbi:basal body-orientation factor 1-like [Embiotoca jacksoni]|uniref:basal body-orientation factor 1-like n=1 Tax=Embiotoca jacksoni TaxID=100190 RepID=UPI003704CF7C
MPTLATSKKKRGKARKGQNNGQNKPKVDKESDSEKVKDNAALWELRLKVTNQSLSETQETCYKFARANEFLTEQLFRAEKDTIETTGHWMRELSAKDEKIHKLEKSLKSHEALSHQEKNKLVSHNNRINDDLRTIKEKAEQLKWELVDIRKSLCGAEEEHNEDLTNIMERFVQIKILHEGEMLKDYSQKLAQVEKDHHETIVQMHECLQTSFKLQLNEALKYHKKETKDLERLTKSLADRNASLELNKDMLELTVKDNKAQMQNQNKMLSKLKTKVASLEQALNLKTGELEELEKEKKENLVTIQASQIDVKKLQNALARQKQELGRVKQQASSMVKKHRELSDFFHEALDHVRQEVVASRLLYKKEALQDYCSRFREATAGKIKFPPIRTFHKSPHSTNCVYSDMEAAATWTYPPDSEVLISDLTWEQKEHVIGLLFAKINEHRERNICQHLAASEEKKSHIGSDTAGRSSPLRPSAPGRPSPRRPHSSTACCVSTPYDL